MKLFQRTTLLRGLAVLCSLTLMPGDALLRARPPQAYDPAGSAGPPDDKKLTPEQLGSLLAPIALYPDPLLGQILAAATYPIQIVEAERWLQAHRQLNSKQLVSAAAKQDWEPSVEALVVFPPVLARMNNNLGWTTSVGNAFLAQQSDVMAAIQRMRKKAYDAGKIASGPQQKVEVQTVEGESVIVIRPASPQVIYVPSYNPAVVYGPPPAYYPYPAMSYPSAGAFYAASAISFGAGIALGAAFNDCCGYGGWGWDCHWGASSAVVVNNNFFGRYGYAAPYARGAYGTAAWTHNPYYRGAVPYSNAAVAGRYAGAVSTPYRSAAGVRTPYGAAGAVSGPRGEAAGVRTPYGSAIKTESGTFSASPYGSASREARTSQTSDWAGSRSFGSEFSGGRSAFGGADGWGGWARASSDRGFDSMSGGGRWGGGWGGGGGRWGGGGGRWGGGGGFRRR